MSKYEKGQVVVLKSDRTVQGAIIDIIESEPETKYTVFSNSGIQSCYESQIESIVHKKQNTNH